MKRLPVTLSLAVFFAVGSASFAAPVESCESSRATALQRIDTFLSEQVVAEQMTALGLTKDEVTACVAKLNDTQIEQLALQIDLLQAGGMIEGGRPQMGVFEKVFKSIGSAFYDIFRHLFGWSGIRHRSDAEMHPTKVGVTPPTMNTYNNVR